MAQYIPGSSVTLAASLSALEKLPAPDDTELQTRLPQICVDYLSHEWEEEDVWASWRNMTRHKNAIANGVRLENASWRTWWKQRNRLPTISPETLNWLKDSDVTWLYGPLHTAADPVPPPKKATAEERYNLEPDPLKGTKQRPVPHKPILKHRTLSELLTARATSALQLADLAYDDFDRGRQIDGNESDSAVLRRSASHRRLSPPGINRTLTNGSTSSGSSGNNITPSNASGGDGKRHISFNTFVEQCVAFPPVAPAFTSSEAAYGRMGVTGVDVDMMDEDEYDYAWTAWAKGEREAQAAGRRGGGYGYERDDEEDEWDDVLEIRSRRDRARAAAAAAAAPPRISPTTTLAENHSARPTPNRTNSNSSTTSNPPPSIIKIAPTILKTSGAFPAPSPAVVFAPPPGASLLAATGPLSPGYRSDGYSDLLPVMHQQRQAAAAANQQWPSLREEDELVDDDAEDGGVGFDYFSGVPAHASADFGAGQEYDVGVAVRRQPLPQHQPATAPGVSRRHHHHSNGREREAQAQAQVQTPSSPREGRSASTTQGGGILKHPVREERGRSATRSPPSDRESGSNSAGSVSTGASSIGPAAAAPPSPTVPKRVRQQTVRPPKPRANPGVTIDTSLTPSSARNRPSAAADYSPPSAGSQHSTTLPSPTASSFHQPAPPPPPPAGGAALTRSTSSSNVRGQVDGDDSLVGKAVGIVSKGLSAFGWGTSPAPGTMNAPGR